MRFLFKPMSSSSSAQAVTPAPRWLSEVKCRSANPHRPQKGIDAAEASIDDDPGVRGGGAGPIDPRGLTRRRFIATESVMNYSRNALLVDGTRVPSHLVPPHYRRPGAIGFAQFSCFFLFSTGIPVFYASSLGFIDLNCTRFHSIWSIIMCFQVFYRSTSDFYWVAIALVTYHGSSLGFIGLLLGFTRFYWVLLGFTGFYWV